MDSTQDARDPTFTTYTSTQAKAYAQNRAAYASEFYEYLFQRHASAASGKCDVIIDVGCGPGNATRDLAKYCKRIIGIDPSPEMIGMAREMGCSSETGCQMEYLVGGAEKLQELAAQAGLAMGTVDMITCAMSAHWFDMLPFYCAAARLLRPGGSLAMWTCSSFYIDQTRTRNGPQIQALLTELETVTLAPYVTEGNRISASNYELLLRPWSFADPEVNHAFSKEEALVKIWNKDGQIEEGKDGFLNGTKELPLDKVMSSLGTASMVTRWRAANRELIEQGEDCIEVLTEKIRNLLGVTKEQDHTVQLRTGNATALILLRRT